MGAQGVKICASKEADGHGDRHGIDQAQAAGERVREGEEVYAQSHVPAYARSHAPALGDEHEDGVFLPGKEEEGHVSETELLIAHVLAAMKDCSLFGTEVMCSSSAQMPKAVTQTSPQECAGVQTSSRAWTSSAACAASETKVATQTSSSRAHAVASTSSSSANTSSLVKGAAWTSSQAKMATRTSSQAHMTTQTSSQARMFARSCSQENAAALCIASLKHTHNKENYMPSNRTLDMQDERVQPKFRNLADLYKLSEL